MWKAEERRREAHKLQVWKAEVERGKVYELPVQAEEDLVEEELVEEGEG